MEGSSSSEHEDKDEHNNNAADMWDRIKFGISIEMECVIEHREMGYESTLGDFILGIAQVILDEQPQSLITNNKTEHIGENIIRCMDEEQFKKMEGTETYKLAIHKVIDEMEKRLHTSRHQGWVLDDELMQFIDKVSEEAERAQRKKNRYRKRRQKQKNHARLIRKNNTQQQQAETTTNSTVDDRYNEEGDTSTIAGRVKQRHRESKRGREGDETSTVTAGDQHSDRSEHTTHHRHHQQQHASDGSEERGEATPQLKQDVDLEAATNNKKNQQVSRYKSGSQSNSNSENIQQQSCRSEQTTHHQHQKQHTRDHASTHRNQGHSHNVPPLPTARPTTGWVETQHYYFIRE